MQDDFEKNINRRMQDFSITPKPEIWQQVEAALPPEKKRRRLTFWWWLLPLMALLGGGMWLTIGKRSTHNSKKENTIRPTTSTTQESSKKTQVISTTNIPNQNPSSTTVAQLQQKGKKAVEPQQHDTMIGVKTIASTDDAKAESQVSVLATRQKRKNGNREIIISKMSKQLFTNTFIVQSDRKAINPPPSLLPGESDKMEQSYVENFPIVKSNASSIQPTKDSLPITPKESITIDSADSIKNITDTNTVLTNATKNIYNKKSRSTWMAELGVGQSWQQSIAASNRLYANQQFSGNPVTGSVQSYNFSSNEPPKASFGFSAGIVRKQVISLHWNWQLAIRYQLLSTTQNYESRRDSLAVYFAADASRISSIYAPGNTSVYHNYIHQIQLVHHIAYTINPAARFPVSISTGLSIAYNISSNQLLHDYRTYNYIRSSAFSTKWLYAAEISASVFLYKKVYAGLLYQHGFSNVAKPALQSDYRWRLWQVRMGLPLFNHSSK